MKRMDRDFWVTSFRKKARRMGIETAMMVMAGSTVLKILTSTVVAFAAVSCQRRMIAKRGEKRRKRRKGGRKGEKGERAERGKSGEQCRDLQLLSEMSSREITFRNETIPELCPPDCLVSRRKETWEGDDIQDAKAHRDERANLLLFVDGHIPDDLPRQEGQDDVKSAGIHCRSVSCPVWWCWSRWLPAARERDIIPNNMKGPAGAWHFGCPELRNGPALNPHYGSRKAKDKVHRDDDEPDEPPDPAVVGEAEEGDGERRLAPCGCHGRTEASGVA